MASVGTVRAAAAVARSGPATSAVAASVAARSRSSWSAVATVAAARMSTRPDVPSSASTMVSVDREPWAMPAASEGHHLGEDPVEGGVGQHRVGRRDAECRRRPVPPSADVAGPVGRARVGAVGVGPGVRVRLGRVGREHERCQLGQAAGRSAGG